MYTILLADDEVSVLDSLKTSIPWQQYGFNTILTATNGAQALELFKKNHIDLLITDIRMPNMDGLELIEQISVLSPATRRVLLTAYSEFEYARKAVILGVENYLIKPIKIDEIEKTIEQAVDNIYISRENSKPLFQNNILLRWLTGNINPEELSERSSFLDINIYLSNYCVICIKTKMSSNITSVIYSSFTKKLSSLYDIYQVLDDQERLVMIIGGAAINIDLLRSVLTDVFRQKSIITTKAAIGIIVSDNLSLGRSYQTACHELDMSDISLPDNIVIANNSLHLKNTDLLIEKIRVLFYDSDEEKRTNGFKEVAENLYITVSPGCKESAIITLKHCLLEIFFTEFPNLKAIQEAISNRIMLFADNSENIDLELAIVELLEYSCLLFKYHFEQLSPVVQLAISYIHNNYSDSISIKEFCVKNKMNTSYLGYIFKKETGMFFNIYLNQYRICCSISLLRDTDLKISEIAQKIGFSSATYYITCFRNQTGLSPIKYRLHQVNQE